MQQTKKYKLNLIEKTDTFSPDPLNGNTEKLEAALSSAETALAAETKARSDADAAETKARKSAASAETKARTDAIAAEAKARADAITAEAKARADADTAETNARKSAVTTETNARKSADTALDTRVKALEARKIVAGTYTGNADNTSSTKQTISLGFKPKLVVIFRPDIYGGVPAATSESASSCLSIADTGFKVWNMGTTLALNTSGSKYNYLAIL